MTPFKQKEIIAELKASTEDYENAIGGTFTFEPQFFENNLLGLLRQKDIRNITVLMDSKSYASSFKACRRAGILYFPEPIYVKHDFHPKFLLMTSKESGKLLIGSGNFTENGFQRDGELFTILDSASSNDKLDIISTFAGMNDFFKSLLEERLIASSKHRELIAESLDVPWLQNKQDSANNNATIRLLHSVKTPILLQVRRILKKEEVKKVTLLSPFFDVKGNVLSYLSNYICKNIQILIQPDRVHNLPKEFLKRLLAQGDLSIFKTSFINEPSRYFHAKIMIFETNRHSYCLTGSANATNSGMLSNAKTGNIEVCLLRFKAEKNGFDDILFNNNISTERIQNTALLKINPLEFEPKITEPDIRIDEAKIDADKLIICFSPSFRNYQRIKAKISISRPVSVEPIVISQMLNGNNRIEVDLTTIIKNYCEESAFLTLELKTVSKSFFSNCHWISTQVTERIPARRDIDLIERTNGRIGLIKFMNQIENADLIPSMILYYLQHLDFDWLSKQFELERKRRFRKYLGIDFDEDHKPPENQPMTSNEILQKLIQRHRNRFHTMVTEEINKSDNIPQLTVRAFNLFLFLSKIAIWFEIRNLANGVSQNITKQMRTFVGTRNKFFYLEEGFGFFDKVAEKVGKKEFLSIYESIGAPFHFLVLSQIMFSLSKNQPLQTRKKLKKRLERILALSFMHDKKLLSEEIMKTKLKEVIQEYDEFEYFVFSERKMFQLAKKCVIHGGYCSKCGRQTVYRIGTGMLLCPHCAKKLWRNSKPTLYQCNKCNDMAWKKSDQIHGLNFCEKDGMLTRLVPGRFRIPVSKL